jgi:LDH2 family malate/lactate/ureidoglycolate dehydrogenase
VLLEPAGLSRLCVGLFAAAGAPISHARVVTDHLIEASMMGVGSHGVIRVPQYLREIKAGELNPKATPEVVITVGARVRIDGGHGFGQVAGRFLADRAEELAREHGLGLAVGRSLGHTGRVGAYPEMLARRGFVALAVCTGPRSGHWVAPFGGRDGRMATNPVAFAFPAEEEAAIVADFSTAATAEGVIRSLWHRGLTAPDGFLRDANGVPTPDPGVLYASPHGAIQPFGGDQGYRGTALAILVEVLATLLAGDDPTDADRVGTNMTVIAVAPDSGFEHLGAVLAAHVRASPPINADRPVMMPGDRERLNAREARYVQVDGPTWTALERAAFDANLALPSRIDSINSGQ